MGIIKATMNAIGASLADQWQEVFEPDDMGDDVVFARGVKVRANDKRNGNFKGTEDIVSNGSVIHVYKDQFMMIVDGGKVVDYTVEEGYYIVDNSSSPSLFNGEFGDAFKDTFQRIKFGGVTPKAQKVYYINMQPIKNIKFGTRNPINYFDNFYNSELFLRAHGSYSIKIKFPMLFYAEVIPKNKDRVTIQDINEQYLDEFLEALQSAINQMSADGIRISFVTSKARELSKYMADILDEDWLQKRGMEIDSVGIASVSYNEESEKLINMRNQGAMLSDPSIREGYVQGAVARGMEAAGSNASGSMAGFMGMGMGMQAGGGFMGVVSQSNQQQIQNQQSMREQQMQQQLEQVKQAQSQERTEACWTCSCGHKNTGKFCTECGKPQEVKDEWICSCGHKNKGKFCSECGAPKPQVLKCKNCGLKLDAPSKFCPECGTKTE